MEIYVGNLNYKIEETVIKEIFEEYGEVSNVKIVSDNVTRRSKGFGFVSMPNDGEAQRAIEELHEGELMGRKIVVNQARPKSENGGDRGSRGGGNRNGGYNRRSY